MRRIFYFLGSVTFALILIATLTIFIVLGTFLESYTGSHLFAAKYTYHHPLFGLLLWLFFLNILISALRRWPFKVKHIAFLVTHLGLLMILGGVMIKNRYGIQGDLTVTEGASSEQVILPHTSALHVEFANGHAFQYPQGSFMDKDFEIAFLDKTPHVKENWESWIKGNFAFIDGAPPLPVLEWNPPAPLPKSTYRHSSGWNILALKPECIEKMIFYSYLDSEQKPLLIFTVDENHESTIWAFNGDGKIYHQSFSRQNLISLWAYDNGFHGYGVQALLPPAKLSVSSDSPSHTFLKTACKAAKKSFPHTLFNFLTYQLLDPSLSPHLAWQDLPQQQQKACYWNSLLFQQLEQAALRGEDSREFLMRNHWPLNLSHTKEPDLFNIELAQQIGTVLLELPPTKILYPLSHQEHLKWLYVYFMIHGITKETFLPEKVPLSFLKAGERIESPIRKQLVAIEALTKLEENRPGIKLAIKKGDQKDEIALAYEANGMGIKWPVLNGEMLIRFEPQKITIPYRIRLRQARQIHYAHSVQPYSYECDIMIEELAKSAEEVTLSMNKVYQTWDGYRFYLASMSSDETEPIKQVHIVVNRDPAKYILTYPGGILIGVGIFLLFWMQPYKRKK